MSRKLNPAQSVGPFHVTARCINRQWFEISQEEVWNIMENYLFFIRHAFGLRIHSFVLMPNHFHLLISAPNLNLSAAMNYFMRETSREIGRQAGRINQVYGGRFFRSLITSNIYFFNVYKYVYRNPIRAGICSRAEEYRFSTLRGLMGMEKLCTPVEEDTILFSPLFNQHELDWINTDPKRDVEDQIRKGLRRTTFSLPRDDKTRKANKFTYTRY